MSIVAGSSVWTGDRRKLSLGPLLKSGGAGSVYRLNESPQQVAKIYHDTADRACYERKVEAMLKLSPHLPDLVENGNRYVQIAWPESLLRDIRGRFLGFVMPAVDIQSTSELECILQERQARAAGLPTGLGAKITLAANLAAVIAELHQQRHHVVDLKPVNLRFYPKSLYMAMLDCDGFSIQGQGERFAAPQFTPDYLAPEFQVRAITVAGEEQQDRFALAVVIFQLLNFGIHPFTGRPASDRVPTDIPGRIANRCYAYGVKASAVLAPSLASGHQSMPLELRQLFDRAFESAGATRPPAMEWSAVLRGYAQRSNQRLVVCSHDAEHQHFVGLPCAACTRDMLIANTAQKNALAARSAASPLKAAARAIGLRPRYTRPTQLPLPPVRRPNPFNRGKTWRLPPPPPPSPPPSWWARKGGGIVARFWAIALVLIWTGISSTCHKYQQAQRIAYPSYPPAQTQAAAQDPDLDPDPEQDITLPSAPRVQPIASTWNVPRPQWPDMWMELNDTLENVEGASKAIVQDNKFAYVGFLSNLDRASSGRRRSSSGPHLQYREDFASLNGFDDPNGPAREALMIKLQQVLKMDRLDGEAAYEWGWLNLLGGESYQSKDAFVRAIWADPYNAAAWYGFAAATYGDDDEVTGAMAIAEIRFASPEFAETVRNRYPVELLQRLGIDPDRFSILQARARRLAAATTGAAVPKDVAALAAMPLPPR